MNDDFEREIETYLDTGWPKKINERRVEFYIEKISLAGTNLYPRHFEGEK